MESIKEDNKQNIFNKLYCKILNIINKIKIYNTKSYLEKHCDREFKLLIESNNYNDNNLDKKYIIAMKQDISNIIKNISKQNFNYDISIFMSILSKITNYKTLTPLRLTNDEFEKVIIGKNVYYQNIRNSSYFKNKNRIYSTNAYIIKILDNEKSNSNNIYHNSNSIYLMDYYISTGKKLINCYVKEKDIYYKNHIPKTFYLTCVKIEIEKDNCIIFTDINSEEFKNLCEYYYCDIIDTDEDYKDKYITNLK